MCIYRSLWERRFMQFCDESSSIVEWSSEEVVVPYLSPIDNKPHRYFVDFWIKAKNKHGVMETMLIEIKPKKQTVVPVMEGKRKTKANMTAAKDWVVNNAKWDAAREYCKDRGWSFKILTEDSILGERKI